MSEWKEATLGDLITLQRGHDLPKSKMEMGNIPVAGSNGIIGYHNTFTTKGIGVTIGRSGNLGNAYLYKANFWAHNTTLYVKDFKGNDELFVYYFLKNIDFKSFNVGSAVPTLNRNHIHPIPIFIPPLPEQKAIAEVLSSLDDKIDLLHRQNKTLEQMAETLFRQWFVEEAKEDWEEIEITDLFEIRDGTHDSPKQKQFGKKLITSKHIKDHRLDFESAYLISEEDFEKVNQRSIVNQFDILFSMIGTIGSIYFEQNNSIDYAIKNVGLFKTSQNKTWVYYTYLWLRSDFGKRFVFENKSGSTQEYISLGSLRSIKFNLPKNIDIQSFNNEVKSLFDKIYTNTTQIRTLEKMRDTLLPKLMSGEVRVKM